MDNTDYSDFTIVLDSHNTTVIQQDNSQESTQEKSNTENSFNLLKEFTQESIKEYMQIKIENKSKYQQYITAPFLDNFFKLISLDIQYIFSFHKPIIPFILEVQTYFLILERLQNYKVIYLKSSKFGQRLWHHVFRNEYQFLPEQIEIYDKYQWILQKCKNLQENKQQIQFVIEFRYPLTLIDELLLYDIKQNPEIYNKILFHYDDEIIQQKLLKQFEVAEDSECILKCISQDQENTKAYVYQYDNNPNKKFKTEEDIYQEEIKRYIKQYETKGNDDTNILIILPNWYMIESLYQNLNLSKFDKKYKIQKVLSDTKLSEIKDSLFSQEQFQNKKIILSSYKILEIDIPFEFNLIIDLELNTKKIWVGGIQTLSILQKTNQYIECFCNSKTSLIYKLALPNKQANYKLKNIQQIPVRSSKDIYTVIYYLSSKQIQDIKNIFDADLQNNNEFMSLYQQMNNMIKNCNNKLLNKIDNENFLTVKDQYIINKIQNEQPEKYRAFLRLKLPKKYKDFILEVQKRNDKNILMQQLDDIYLRLCVYNLWICTVGERKKEAICNSYGFKASQYLEDIKTKIQYIYQQYGINDTIVLDMSTDYSQKAQLFYQRMYSGVILISIQGSKPYILDNQNIEIQSNQISYCNQYMESSSDFHTFYCLRPFILNGKLNVDCQAEFKDSELDKDKIIMLRELYQVEQEQKQEELKEEEDDIQEIKENIKKYEISSVLYKALENDINKLSEQLKVNIKYQKNECYMYINNYQQNDLQNLYEELNELINKKIKKIRQQRKEYQVDFKRYIAVSGLNIDQILFDQEYISFISDISISASDVDLHEIQRQINTLDFIQSSNIIPKKHSNIDTSQLLADLEITYKSTSSEIKGKLQEVIPNSIVQVKPQSTSSMQLNLFNLKNQKIYIASIVVGKSTGKGQILFQNETQAKQVFEEFKKIKSSKQYEFTLEKSQHKDNLLLIFNLNENSHEDYLRENIFKIAQVRPQLIEIKRSNSDNLDKQVIETKFKEEFGSIFENLQIHQIVNNTNIVIDVYFSTDSDDTVSQIKTKFPQKIEISGQNIIMLRAARCLSILLDRKVHTKIEKILSQMKKSMQVQVPYVSSNKFIELFETKLPGESYKDKINLNIVSNVDRYLFEFKKFIEQNLKGQVIQLPNSEYKYLLKSNYSLNFIQKLESKYQLIMYVQSDDNQIKLIGQSQQNIQQFTNELLEYLSTVELKEDYIPLLDTDIQIILRDGLEFIENAEETYSLAKVELDRNKKVLSAKGLPKDLSKYINQVKQNIGLLRKNKGKDTKIINKQSNQEEYQICDICFSILSDSYRLTSCCHIFCISCLHYTITQCIKDRTHLPVKCPKCNDLIVLDDIEILIKRNEIENILKNSIKIYMLKHQQEFIQCPTSFCQQFFYKKLEDVEVIHCQECLRTFCPKCLKEAHPDLKCEQKQKIDQADEEFLKNMQDFGIKFCPKCKAPIEKNGGCQHIECSSCFIHLCWSCLETFETRREAYAHLLDVHKSFV